MPALLLIGLIAGIVTALSPCVLPVLPILLAGGASGRKPLRIIAGLVRSFVVFTLFATWLLDKLGLPDDLLRNIAIALLFVVAATLLVPQAGLLVERPFAALSRLRPANAGGGFLLGASLGLVFVPCAGPVLGAITVVAANNHVGVARDPADARLRARRRRADAADRARRPEAAGAAARAGGSRSASPPGVVIALVALGIAFNVDDRFQTALRRATRTPCRSTIEEQLDARSASSRSSAAAATALAAVAREPPAGLPDYGVAPPLIAGGDWFNTKPLTLDELRGKVVLLDFWTYSCINCLRTLPHLKAWYAAYRKQRARDHRRPHAGVRVRARRVERRAPRSSGSASATRSSRTTTTPPGTTTRTSTGPPST